MEGNFIKDNSKAIRYNGVYLLELIVFLEELEVIILGDIQGYSISNCYIEILPEIKHVMVYYEKDCKQNEDECLTTNSIYTFLQNTTLLGLNSLECEQFLIKCGELPRQLKPLMSTINQVCSPAYKPAEGSSTNIITKDMIKESEAMAKAKGISEQTVLKNPHYTDIEKFGTICTSMLELYSKKNADYGSSFSKLYEEFGLQSATIRLTDKLNRLKSLTINKQQVKDESIKDTLIDLANYAIMTLIELDKNGQ